MERIEEQGLDQAELAKDTLAWITCAKELISVPQLREALAVRVGVFELDEDDCSDIEDIISACAGIVTVDKGSGIIRLVHYTTQEYFERTRELWFPNADTMITDACTTYPVLTSFGRCR
jgi:hypothetical protein